MKYHLGKTLVLALLFGLNLLSIAQNKIDSLKVIIEKDLEKFIETSKGIDSLRHINIFALNQLISNISKENTPKLYDIGTYDDVSIELSLNLSDTSFSYCYMNWILSESFYKNRSYTCAKFDNESNLIPTITNIINLISTDTIANVVTTKPTKSSYDVYRSLCPGGESKQEAFERFKRSLFGQYSLKVRFYGDKITWNFIAPPHPSSKLVIKHTAGHF